MKQTARQILGDEDFEYLKKEVLSINSDTSLSYLDKMFELERLLESWELDTDYLNEFLKD